VSPADSFATAIGVGIGIGVGLNVGIGIGIGIGVGIELTNPLFAKLLADRVATLSALREHGHTTIEQCLLLAVVVCGQRFAHQQARPQSQRTPAPSLVRFQMTGVDPRSSLCRYPRHCSARWPAMRAYDARLRCAKELILRVTLSFHMLAVALGPADRLDGRTLDVALLMTEWHRAFSLSIPIPIPIATPTPIALRRCLDSVV
jgi:hypothetical protein